MKMSNNSNAYKKTCVMNTFIYIYVVDINYITPFIYPGEIFAHVHQETCTRIFIAGKGRK